MKPRWYDSTAVASLAYYYNDTIFMPQHFYVKTRPVVSDPTVLSETGTTQGGWGETWTFHADLTDEDLDTVTVYLETRKYGEGAGAWQVKNVTTVTSPINNTVNLTLYDEVSFKEAALVNGTVTWEFRLHAVDDCDLYGFSGCPYDDYTDPVNFTIEKDNVSVTYIEGNHSKVWRNGTMYMNFTFLVTDTDRDDVVESGRSASVWSTYDHENYTLVAATSTIEGGYVSVSIDPECTDVPFYNVHPELDGWHQGRPVLLRRKRDHDLLDAQLNHKHLHGHARKRFLHQRRIFQHIKPQRRVRRPAHRRRHIHIRKEAHVPDVDRLLAEARFLVIPGRRLVQLHVAERDHGLRGVVGHEVHHKRTLLRIQHHHKGQRLLPGQCP
jgi:hypothetical protein